MRPNRSGKRKEERFLPITLRPHISLHHAPCTVRQITLQPHNTAPSTMHRALYTKIHQITLRPCFSAPGSLHRTLHCNHSDHIAPHVHDQSDTYRCWSALSYQIAPSSDSDSNSDSGHLTLQCTIFYLHISFKQVPKCANQLPCDQISLQWKCTASISNCAKLNTRVQLNVNIQLLDTALHLCHISLLSEKGSQKSTALYRAAHSSSTHHCPWHKSLILNCQLLLNNQKLHTSMMVSKR